MRLVSRDSVYIPVYNIQSCHTCKHGTETRERQFFLCRICMCILLYSLKYVNAKERHTPTPLLPVPLTKVHIPQVLLILIKSYMYMNQLLCLTILYIYTFVYLLTLTQRLFWIPQNTFYSGGLYFRVNSRKHGDAKIKPSPIISNERIKEQDTTNRENKVSWIYPRWWPRENKVTRIISVLQYQNIIYKWKSSTCEYLQHVIAKYKSWFFSLDWNNLEYDWLIWKSLMKHVARIEQCSTVKTVARDF